jgi:exonuclease VII small subunit
VEEAEIRRLESLEDSVAELERAVLLTRIRDLESSLAHLEDRVEALELSGQTLQARWEWYTNSELHEHYRREH